MMNLLYICNISNILALFNREKSIVSSLLIILLVFIIDGSVSGQNSNLINSKEHAPSEYDRSSVCDFIDSRIHNMDAVQKNAHRSQIIRLLPKYEDDNYGEFRYSFNINSEELYFDFTINQFSREFILEFAQYVNYSGFYGVYREKSMVYSRFGIIMTDEYDIIHLPCSGFTLSLFFESDNNSVSYIRKFTISRTYRG